MRSTRDSTSSIRARWGQRAARPGSSSIQRRTGSRGKVSTSRAGGAAAGGKASRGVSQRRSEAGIRGRNRGGGFGHARLFSRSGGRIIFSPLTGNIAQFALFDRALTADEAKQLHAASAPAVGTPKTAAVSLESKPIAAKLSEPLSPEESLKKIHVPAGFKVELVAAEPLLLDPVAFDWDERGRLWVVEMADYPLGMDNKGKPGGRVRVLEDSDGDGRYDKSTLFADGLNFPNGLLTGAMA